MLTDKRTHRAKRQNEQHSTVLGENQKGLWRLVQMQPDTNAYNIQVLFRVGPQCQLPVLEKAFALMLQQYPLLCAAIIEKNGEPHYDYPYQAKDFATEHCDLSQLNDEQEKAWLKNRQAQGFCLQTTPLTRSFWIKRSGDHNILLLEFHHLVIDGISLLAVIDTLWQAYVALLKGQQPQFAATQSHNDLIKWECEMLHNEQGAAQLAYWRKQLEGELPVLALPTDRPRTAETTLKGKTASVKLGERLTRRLSNFKAQHPVNTSVIFLATFNTILHRYSGQNDIVVGMPSKGRPSELAQAFGFFTNMLPIRTRFNKNQTFVHLLTELAHTLKEGNTHSTYPFARLVNDSEIKTNRSVSPLFQTAFAYQGFFHHGQQQFAQAYQQYGINPVEVNQPADKDFGLEVHKLDSDFMLHFKYNSELFDAATINTMVGHYMTLLDNMLQNPYCLLSDYDCLLSSEKQKMLVDYNNTQVDYDNQQTLQSLFETQAKTKPAHTALICEEQSLTFGALNKQANQLAHVLITQGIGPNSLVSICFNRSVEMVISMLGILKAGGAYVPINPQFSEDRIAYLLDDTQTKLLLTHSKLAGILPEHACKTIELDNYQSVLASQPTTNPVLPNPAKATDLCYVIYTSGSTGKPKGVMVEHLGIVNLANHLNGELAAINMADDAVWGWNASYAFDASVQALSQLILGTTCNIIPETVRKDPNALAQFIIDQQINIFDCTPSQLKMLMSVFASDKNTTVKHPLCFFIGGESIHVDLWQQIAAFCQQTQGHAFNVYGLTECCVDSTITPIVADLPPNIGKPLANTQIYILDQQGKPVPRGVNGELYIGGDGLARGYLNRAELTEERFIANPFDKANQLYRTGDQARFLQTGHIEFLGRFDDQVKIRGYRIELGEIENQLSAIEGVSEAVVTVQNDSQNNPNLVAYVVADENLATTAYLKQNLGKQLPDYMVPVAYKIMDSFPHTPSGKADRKVLMCQRVEIKSSQHFVAPQTPLQVELAEIWQDVLTVSRIGLEDDFYQLGGHSLLAIVLVDKINSRFDSNLSVHHLLQNKNIAALSALLDVTTVPDDTIDHIVPLSATQMDKDKNAPKVFFVHGIGGNVISFYPLVDDMEKAPVQATPLDCYGVESLGYNTGGTLYATADEMIEQYTNAIKQTQGEGPYHIVGWSYGAMVAKQIVKKLLQQGHQVQSFISIDAQAPDPQMLKNRFGQFQGDNLSQIANSDIKNLMGLYEKMFDHQPAKDLPVLSQLCDLLGFAPTDCDKQKQQYAKMTFSHLSNAGQFCPSPIAPKNTLIIKAAQTRYGDFESRWHEQIDGNVTFEEHQGDHWSVLQQQSLSESINRFISLSENRPYL